MLKVVDGYDLKKLNKYGFVYHYETYTRRTFDWDIVDYINEEETSEFYEFNDKDADVTLTFFTDERELIIGYDYDGFVSDKIIGVIFDIVKDGVVEKVSRT